MKNFNLPHAGLWPASSVFRKKNVNITWMFSIEKKPKHQSKKRNVICFWKRFYYQSESIDKSGAGEITEKMYDFTSFPTDTQNSVASDDDRLSRQTASDSASRRELWKFRDFLRSHNEGRLINILNLARLERKPRRWWKEFFAFSCEKHSSGWFHWWDLMIVRRWGRRWSPLFAAFSERKSGNGGSRRKQ